MSLSRYVYSNPTLQLTDGISNKHFNITRICWNAPDYHWRKKWECSNVVNVRWNFLSQTHTAFLTICRYGMSDSLKEHAKKSWNLNTGFLTYASKQINIQTYRHTNRNIVHHCRRQNEICITQNITMVKINFAWITVLRSQFYAAIQALLLNIPKHKHTLPSANKSYCYK